MAVMASWNKRKWEVSRNKLIALENLANSVKIKSKKTENEAGDTLDQPIGFELEAITFDFRVADAVGVDVRREWEIWKSQCGKTAPLYVGGKKFGPDMMRLKEAKFSAELIDNSGRIRTAVISLVFEEYALEGANKTRIRQYVALKKSSAIKVGAKKSDKAAKKPVKKAVPTTTKK